ncbi:hypothetical protein DFP74_0250 [Nocardiopsis sp. Huas11]|uniref:hypothetical protein n=1 Tax=Nocardiopsis sp. Huas11 TaxID=2183912 RepID=UPI000F19557A|nr:hypothetical protein [Nocardiopsis sp. Huas11]RKS04683.1 hypothetical protein DFP74_0250 [Nocardiopsis sp. Huas11]
MRRKRVWATVLAVIAVVSGGLWALTVLFPGWGLNELNQVSGIASLAVGAASLLVGVWALVSAPAGGAAPGARPVENSVVGDVSGTVVQGDHIDFSGGTFHGEVVGKREDRRPGPQDGPAGR